MKDTAYYVDVVYTGKICMVLMRVSIVYVFNKGRCKHIDAVKQFIEDLKIEKMNKNIAVENTAELIDFKD
jgi:hypothetical protein